MSFFPALDGMPVNFDASVCRYNASFDGCSR